MTAGVEAYCRRMRRYTTMPELDLWYDGTHVDSLIDYFEPADRGRVSVHIEKKRERRTSLGAFAKLTNMAGGRPRITEEPPVRVTISDAEQAELVGQFLAEYRLTLQEDRQTLFDRFTETDMVRQVVGVGSVGMRVYLVLMEGRSGTDPLFLQVKQAGPSVYEAHAGPSRHDTHGARVISGKRLIQSATDMFVGWGSMGGRDYYVRQFRDMKIIPTTALIAPRLAVFATACGETLARAHARTGDAVAIAGYIGKGSKFTAAISRFAGKYADQNERDHAQLVRLLTPAPSRASRGDDAASADPPAGRAGQSIRPVRSSWLRRSGSARMSISVILSSRMAMPIRAKGWPPLHDEETRGAVDEHRPGEARQGREKAGRGDYLRCAADQPGRAQRAGARVGAEHHVRVEDGQQALEVLPARGGQEGGGHRALPGGIGRGCGSSAALAGAWLGWPVAWRRPGNGPGRARSARTGRRRCRAGRRRAVRQETACRGRPAARDRPSRPAAHAARDHPRRR